MNQLFQTVSDLMFSAITLGINNIQLVIWHSWRWLLALPFFIAAVFLAFDKLRYRLILTSLFLFGCINNSVFIIFILIVILWIRNEIIHESPQTESYVSDCSKTTGTLTSVNYSSGGLAGNYSSIDIGLLTDDGVYETFQSINIDINNNLYLECQNLINQKVIIHWKHATHTYQCCSGPSMQWITDSRWYQEILSVNPINGVSKNQ